MGVKRHDQTCVKFYEALKTECCGATTAYSNVGYERTSRSHRTQNAAN